MTTDNIIEETKLSLEERLDERIVEQVFDETLEYLQCSKHDIGDSSLEDGLNFAIHLTIQKVRAEMFTKDEPSTLLNENAVGVPSFPSGEMPKAERKVSGMVVLPRKRWFKRRLKGEK